MKLKTMLLMILIVFSITAVSVTVVAESVDYEKEYNELKDKYKKLQKKYRKLGRRYESLKNRYETETGRKKEESPATVPEQTEELNLVTEPEQTLDLQDGYNEFLSGGYLYITGNDLEKYAPNMTGCRIYTVGTISDFNDNAVQITLADGFMMSNFDVGDRISRYENAFKRNDTVAILGTIESYDDFWLVGRSVKLNNCYIFAYGDDANSYIQSQSDPALSGYFVVTEEIANSSQSGDISEGDYKALCQYYPYEDILRNPDAYKNKYAIVTGTVDQTISGFFSDTLYIADDAGNKWECVYSYKDGEGHLLEGDYVSVYGKCDGTTTSTTLLGKQVTLPYVRVEYIR